MKTASLRRAFEKAGLEVTKQIMKDEGGVRYFVSGTNNFTTWFDENGVALCLYIKRNGAGNNEGCFLGSFAKTIEQTVAWTTE